MKFNLTFTTSDRAVWRRWLAENGSLEKEVWLVYIKKESGRPSIDYEDSVEEALCYGWVDSLIQKIDEDSYARKFTRRTNTQKWSASNLRRMQKMIAEGRMTEAGLAVIDPEILKLTPADLERPDDEDAFEAVRHMLQEHALAWQNFSALAPSHQRRYLGWINAAKQQATRERRVAEAALHLEKNEPLPLK
jgi:uncharacterized protein YdeI (YjbR/CyaY-like superfamily)